jgi:hypothetical protein
MNEQELIKYIRELNKEFGVRIIHFRRHWGKNKTFWHIWYGYCGENGEGRMAFWATTLSAHRTVTVIAKMHRLLAA